MVDMTQFDFNPAERQPREKKEFELLPPDTYTAVITDSELRDTKAGTGNYIELSFQIIDGPHARRMLWNRYNMSNPNPKAVEIGRDQIAAVAHAVGVPAFKATEELHNIPLKIRVDTQVRKDTLKEESRIFSYESIGAAGSGSGEKGGTSHQNPPSQRAVPAPSWKR